MFSLINIPSSLFPPWNVWPTSKILGRRAMGDYRRPARYVKVASNSSTYRRLFASVPLNPSAPALYVSNGLQTASNSKWSRFRRDISLRPESRSFWMDSRVPFDRFNYVALRGRMPEKQLFLYTLLCIMIACYCKKEEEERLRFHPKFLHTNPPPPINCDWLQEVLYEGTQFVALLL